MSGRYMSSYRQSVVDWQAEDCMGNCSEGRDTVVKVRELIDRIGYRFDAQASIYSCWYAFAGPNGANFETEKVPDLLTPEQQKSIGLKCSGNRYCPLHDGCKR